VRFDPTALSQAVINLLDNAAKYSGQSRQIAVRLDVRDGDLVVEVEDHGFGIPSSELDRIFERFYRIPNGSGKGGYGLGLFMVRHIMDAHGGSVEVDSEPGRGSRFRLIFPVTKQWVNSASL
jgi:two-component system phosphate regulon sensor histidine kinase PhoR